MTTKQFEGMKRIRNILASWSLMAFVVAFATFVICALLGCYGVLAWSGLIAVVAFAVFFSSANPHNNAKYVNSIKTYGSRTT